MQGCWRKFWLLNAQILLQQAAEIVVKVSIAKWKY